MSVIVKGGGGGKSSGQYVWKKYNAVIGLGESTNNIALANDGTSIDTYVKENLYIKEDGTIGIQGEPYSTVAISSVMEGSCVGGMTPVKYCVGVDGSVYYSPVCNIEGSVDNCTATPVSAIKGTFIEYITNNDENKYPDGGTQDGYWYKKFDTSTLIPENIREGVDVWGVIGTMSEGVTGIEYGTFTVTSSKAVTVQHSLGVTPKYVGCILVTNDVTTGCNIGEFARLDTYSHKNSYYEFYGGFAEDSAGPADGGSIFNDSDYCRPTATSTAITFNANYAFIGTYIWYAIE